jgi:hypothetical protein
VRFNQATLLQTSSRTDQIDEALFTLSNAESLRNCIDNLCQKAIATLNIDQGIAFAHLGYEVRTTDNY